jgi:putative ABC transport system permease protein
MILKEDENSPTGTYLMGVDFGQYQKMFPGNFSVLEGRALKPGEKGLLMPTHIRDMHIYPSLNTWIIPEGGKIVDANLTKEAREDRRNIVVSSSIVLMGTASGVNSSTDIRFGVKGIIKYGALNTIFGHFCITDIESYLECMGYFSSAENAVEVPKEEKKLLTMENSDMDSMFGSEPLIVANKAAGAPKLKQTSAAGTDTNGGSEFGTYNIVYVKLKDGISYDRALTKLNKALTDKGTGVRAVTWNKASGPIGSMTLIIKSALFLFVTLLFVVAVIIIINTLTMAALERTSEIGMMRAVGARKIFIGGMFFGETGLLSAVFGGAGIVAGIILVKIIPFFKITTSNDMVQLLYGGDIFSPLLKTPDIALTIFQLILVTIVASLYPVAVARNITPLDAIQRD